MEKTVITFNDLPEVVAQLRDEVMSLRNLLTEQRSVNNAKAVDTHVPMSVEEAAEYRKRLSKYIFYSSFSLLTFATKK